MKLSILRGLACRVLAGFGIALTFHSPLLLAAEPETLDKKLQVVLEREAAGQAVDRRLDAGVVPQDEQSAWHAGQVNVNDQWLKAEDLVAPTTADEYSVKRDALNASPQKHLQLARWCVLNQLPELARAHYFGALTTAPNLAEARQYLRHVLIDDVWVDRGDLQVAQQEFHQRLAELEATVPKLKSIIQGMESQQIQTKSKALQDLANFDPSGAVPALELFASNVNDDLAKPILKKLASVRSKAACEALVRIALARSNPEIQRLTVEAIRKYPESYYVPGLLAMLSSELKIEHGLVMHPNGMIGMSTVVMSELQNRKVAQRLDKMVRVVGLFSSTRSASITQEAEADVSFWSIYWKIPKSDPANYGRVAHKDHLGNASSSFSAVHIPAAVAGNAAENLKEQGLQQSRAVAQQNRAIQERVNRVCTLLRGTTLADIGDQPTAWWQWWNDRNERYESEKPTFIGYQQQKQYLEVSTVTRTSEDFRSMRNLGHIFTQYSCLIPGTLIQTATGLRPIEQIQIGDFVLAQNVETAELTLKPVLLTTIRPPKSTLQIKTNSDMIEATGGHLWWIGGKGWTKTRDLQPGMMLRTASGTAEITSITPVAEEKQTHNLIVDGFHTYFVGPERILSYDNSLPKPTLRTVPGFGVLADVDAQ